MCVSVHQTYAELLSWLCSAITSRAYRLKGCGVRHRRMFERLHAPGATSIGWPISQPGLVAMGAVGLQVKRGPATMAMISAATTYTLAIVGCGTGGHYSNQREAQVA